MDEKLLDHWRRTSTYTYAGAYEDYFKSLPDDIPTIGKLVCGQLTHPTMFFIPVSKYLMDTYFGDFSSYSPYRFKNEDNLFVTAAALTAEIFRLDERGFVEGKDINKRLTVSCRYCTLLFNSILKAKRIPCRSRTGVIDFGNEGKSYTEHWVNEYWHEKEKRWVLVDADGYYEYENRFGYSQFDLPRKKFIPSAELWIGLRNNKFDDIKIDLYYQDILYGAACYLFMDFHSIMNNEIDYSYETKLIHNKIQKIDESNFDKIDHLAYLMTNPDDNFSELLDLWQNKKEYYLTINPGQELYEDVFCK